MAESGSCQVSAAFAMLKNYFQICNISICNLNTVILYCSCFQENGVISLAKKGAIMFLLTAVKVHSPIGGGSGSHSAGQESMGAPGRGAGTAAEGGTDWRSDQNE